MQVAEALLEKETLTYIDVYGRRALISFGPPVIAHSSCTTRSFNSAGSGGRTFRFCLRKLRFRDSSFPSSSLASIETAMVALANTCPGRVLVDWMTSRIEALAFSASTAAGLAAWECCCVSCMSISQSTFHENNYLIVKPLCQTSVAFAIP